MNNPYQNYSAFSVQMKCDRPTPHTYCLNTDHKDRIVLHNVLFPGDRCAQNTPHSPEGFDSLREQERLKQPVLYIGFHILQKLCFAVLPVFQWLTLPE